MRLLFLPLVILGTLFEALLLSFCKSDDCYQGSGGGRLAEMTDAERAKHYADTPDEIPTLRQCLTDSKRKRK